MPHLDYVFIDLEMKEFTEFLLGEGFRFIPNFHYEQPAPWELTSLGEILELAENKGYWFLTHPEFSHLPLEMKASTGKLSGTYDIAQRSGGPTIDLFWSGTRTYKGIHFVRMGSVSHYPSFWNHQSGEMQKAPPAQRKAYQIIVRYIKRNSVVSEKLRVRRAWIGRRAAVEWTRGLQLGWEGYIVRPKQG